MAKTTKIKMTDLSRKNQKLSPEQMKKVTGGRGIADDAMSVCGKKSKGGIWVNQNSKATISKN